MQDIITIKNLSYNYPDGNCGIKDINLNIEKGSTVAIVGENGAGKSTLFSLLVGIINSSNKDSEIIIDGIKLGKDTVKAIRKKVGFVFQNPEEQLFMPTVYDDIAFGAINQGIKGKELDDIMNKVLNGLNLKHLVARMSTRLSGGEKRVVAIASVVICSPDVILFDEPTAFLDPVGRKKCLRLIKKLPQTKIIATHDIDMVYEVCDRVVIIKNGEIFASGDVQEVLSDNDLLVKAGLSEEKD